MVLRVIQIIKTKISYKCSIFKNQTRKAIRIKITKSILLINPYKNSFNKVIEIRSKSLFFKS
jgi:hypothetical protein